MAETIRPSSHEKPTRQDWVEKFGAAGLFGIFSGGTIALVTQDGNQWIIEILKQNGLAGVVIFVSFFTNVVLWKEIKSQRRELNSVHREWRGDLEADNRAKDGMIERFVRAIDKAERATIPGAE